MSNERSKSIKLSCPKCGASFKHWSYLEDAATSRNILEREGNTLHIAADYEVAHPVEAADENPRFVCMGTSKMMRAGKFCNTVIPIPEGLRLEFDD
jgi:hypothetical protein